MIGHHTTVELAAASFVNNIFNLVIIFALGFSYAVTPMVGTLRGMKESGRIGEVVKNALAANSLLAVTLVAAMSVFYSFIGEMGQPAELLPLIRPYFLILLASLPFVCLFNVFKQFADGITDTSLSMWVLTGGNVLNIFGNWLLIYGHFGLPEMGLNGAGISTLLARAFMTLVMAVIFFSAGKYRVYSEGFRKGHLNGEDFRHVNSLGWPVALQMGMETASFSLTSIIVGWTGTTALAAHQIMLTVGQFGFMLYYGIGAAALIMVSNAVGRSDYREAHDYAYAAFRIVLVMAIAVCIPIFILRHHLGSLFSSDAEVNSLVALTVVPFILYQFGDAMQIVFGNSIRGLSYVRPLVFFAFIAFFVVSLPLAYIFAIVLKHGLVGVWLSFPFGLTTAGLLYMMTFRRRLAAVAKRGEWGCGVSY